MLGNLGLVIILIPSVIFAATHFGALGAGYVWLTMNALFLFGWVAYVHHKLEPGLHTLWLWNDVVKILLPVSIVACFLFTMESLTKIFHVVNDIFFVIIVGSIISSVALLCSGHAKLIFNKR